MTQKTRGPSARGEFQSAKTAAFEALKQEKIKREAKTAKLKAARLSETRERGPIEIHGE